MSTIDDSSASNLADVRRRARKRKSEGKERKRREGYEKEKRDGSPRACMAGVINKRIKLNKS
jgi:hypothetical protein